jgi:predicted Rossmann fold nucleotide-binding protein DprA/Smf involved in DNA uptake
VELALVSTPPLPHEAGASSAHSKRFAQFDCRIVTQDDHEYPKLSRQIYNLSIELYVSKALRNPKHKNSLAMVSSRQYTWN